MTNWALIAGGRCAGQPWRVGIAGFCVDERRAFLFSDADWAELQQQLPFQPLMAYGEGNGLSFERATDGACAVDGMLLVAHARQDQAVLDMAPSVKRYALLRTAAQHEALANEASFAKVFTPMQAPRFDERLVTLEAQLLTDPACPDPQAWAAVREPEDRDYARLYHRSADFWIRQVTTTIADDAAAARHFEPLLSVVIPTYNYGRYLAQCVQSVLDQGVDDIEVLVLDNASTDDTPQVMAAFADNTKVRYIRNRHNYGPGYNWRNGLRIAQGRYFTFLSADDYFNPGHLSRLLPALERHPHVAVGYTGIRWVNGAGQALNQPRHPGYRNGDYIGGRNEVADLLIYDSYMTPSAVIYRREAFRRVWNPGKSYGAGDWEMVVQMAERYPDFAYVDVPGVSYRWHGAQESTQFYASREPLMGHLAIVEGVFERNAQHHLRGHEREVAAHLKRRLALYPGAQASELGARTQQLCQRLEGLAQQPEGAAFSVILTCYQRPQSLRAALDHVLPLSAKGVEVILLNASGAPVEPILADYDFPITYIRQGRDRSPAAARNAALQLARGQYVVFLEDDSLPLASHLETLAKRLEAHPDSVVQTDASFLQQAAVAGEGNQQHECLEPHARARLLVTGCLPANTFACPRALALAVGGFDESLTGQER